MTPQEHLLAQVEQHEGYRMHCYDDATGKPIRPGVTVKGHPTVGIGLALDVNGLELDEARWILDRRLRQREGELRGALPWFDSLNAVRKNVLIELAFNCGTRSALSFRKLLTAAMFGHWAVAAFELKDSKWATQVQPARVATLARQLETGEW